MSASNLKSRPAIPVLLLVLLTVLYFGSVTCLGSDTAEEPNSIQAGPNNTSGIAIVGNSPREEDRNYSTGSEDETGSIQSTSSDEPNSAAETALDANHKDVNTQRQPGPEAVRRRLPSLTSGKMFAFYITIGIAVIAVAGWFFLSKTGRTRIAVQDEMKRDKDIEGEFLIVFNWSQKVLYLPTIIASLFAATLMYLQEDKIWFFASMAPKTIGGIWFAIFFLNFLVEEYNIRLTVIITSLVSVGFLFLWLYLAGWVIPFFRLFRHLAFSISGTGYLLVGLIGLLTIVISWIRGLFYFAVITPNFVNVQVGLTETGEQIARRDFYTGVDTTDLVERLFGVGKIIITFTGRERKPMTLLVWRIGAKAKKLEEMGTKTIVT